MANLADLQRRLDGQSLSGLDSLDADDMDRLIRLFESAEADQDQALRLASEQALQHVPRLLRPALRKLLFK